MLSGLYILLHGLAFGLALLCSYCALLLSNLSPKHHCWRSLALSFLLVAVRRFLRDPLEQNLYESALMVVVSSLALHSLVAFYRAERQNGHPL